MALNVDGSDSTQTVILFLATNSCTDKTRTRALSSWKDQSAQFHFLLGFSPHIFPQMLYYFSVITLAYSSSSHNNFVTNIPVNVKKAVSLLFTFEQNLFCLSGTRT